MVAEGHTRALDGLSVVVTRARSQASALADLLEDAGAEVLTFPTIAFDDPEDWAPVDEAIRHLDVYSWVIFSSVNAVERFFARLGAADKDARHLAGLRVAAVGPATAAACSARGVNPDFVPDEHVGEGVLSGLCARGVGEGTRILIPRALEAREVLPEELRRLGAFVDVVTVYRTVRGPGDPVVLRRMQEGTVDAVTFTSSSTVRHFLALAEGVDFSRMIVACIGPVTAKTAREAGLRVDVEPEEYTVPALVDALVAYVQAHPRRTD